MRDRMEILNDKALYDPEVVYLACGHSIPNVGGIVVWDFYDMEEYTTTIVSRPDVDTSGRLPNGVTYWFGNIDGSRACCMTCRR